MLEYGLYGWILSICQPLYRTNWMQVFITAELCRLSCLTLLAKLKILLTSVYFQHIYCSTDFFSASTCIQVILLNISIYFSFYTISLHMNAIYNRHNLFNQQLKMMCNTPCFSNTSFSLLPTIYQPRTHFHSARKYF